MKTDLIDMYRDRLYEVLIYSPFAHYEDVSLVPARISAIKHMFYRTTNALLIGYIPTLATEYIVVNHLNKNALKTRFENFRRSMNFATHSISIFQANQIESAILKSNGMSSLD